MDWAEYDSARHVLLSVSFYRPSHFPLDNERARGDTKGYIYIWQIEIDINA